ncbi:MAG: hypothetical protein HXY34_06610 [Candidatus Thorarchaeota archaeon]|nr:hypothetical protein [Candidatus Thorarchaeota archaeon]
MSKTAVVSVIVLACLIICVPVRAIEFPVASYTDDWIVVDVHLSAPDHVETSIPINVTVVIGLVPLSSGVTQINITEVAISIHRAEKGGGFTLAGIGVDRTLETFNHDHANISRVIRMTATLSGMVCYFAVSVSGTYRNGTDSSLFSCSSNENLIGPFSVYQGLTSPQSLVGLAMTVVFIAAIVLGACGIRKSRRGTRQRRSLLDE